MDTDEQSPRRQAAQSSSYSRNPSSQNKPGKRLFNDRARGRRDHKDRANAGFNSSRDPVPTLLLKSRIGDERSYSPSTGPSYTSGITPIVPKRESENTSLHPNVAKPISEVLNPFASLPNLRNPVKLLDDKFDFCDALQEYLLDQPDFVVISIIGLQGTGKSTILSALAKEDNEIFRRSSKEQLLISEAATTGIDVYVNSNRIIYLDCQPLLSASVANKEINYPTELFKDNYITYEAPSVETSMEIKALQMLAFLMCVSHHVMLVQDWILDSNLLRLLCTAEMLKPTIPGYDDQYDHYPNVILVHNKVQEDEADPSNVMLLRDTYIKCFQSTRLPFSNNSGFFQEQGSDFGVNLVLLPSFDTPSPLNDFTPFSFLGTFDEEIRKLREHLFCLPRGGLTLNALTEKNWLYYAGKVWDTVRKSSLIMEYSRLL